jgi:hypothetical protein
MNYAEISEGTLRLGCMINQVPKSIEGDFHGCEFIINSIEQNMVLIDLKRQTVGALCMALFTGSTQDRIYQHLVVPF